MGSQCSRSPQQDSVTPGGLTGPPSERKKTGDKMYRFHCSRGSSHEASCFESVESKPLASIQSGMARNILAAPPEVPRPIAEDSPSGSGGNSFATPNRSAETPLPEGAIMRENQRWRTALPSSPASGVAPAYINEENIVTPWHTKRTLSPTTWASTRQPLHRSTMRRCHTFSFHPFQKSNSTLATSQDDYQSESSLDKPARKMFFEFFQRNLREQRRHEEALKETRPVPKWSSGSLVVPDAEEPLAATPQGIKRSEVGPEELEEYDAEVEAVKALDMFSPDERNTRLDEFLSLVSASE